MKNPILLQRNGSYTKFIFYKYIYKCLEDTVRVQKEGFPEERKEFLEESLELKERREEPEERHGELEE